MHNFYAQNWVRLIVYRIMARISSIFSSTGSWYTAASTPLLLADVDFETLSSKVEDACWEKGFCFLFCSPVSWCNLRTIWWISFTSLPISPRFEPNWWSDEALGACRRAARPLDGNLKPLFESLLELPDATLHWVVILANIFCTLLTEEGNWPEALRDRLLSWRASIVRSLRRGREVGREESVGLALKDRYWFLMQIFLCWFYVCCFVWMANEHWAIMHSYVDPIKITIVIMSSDL